jgi:hypothetical protein
MILLLADLAAGRRGVIFLLQVATDQVSFLNALLELPRFSNRLFAVASIILNINGITFAVQVVLFLLIGAFADCGLSHSI